MSQPPPTTKIRPPSPLIIALTIALITFLALPAGTAIAAEFQLATGTAGGTEWEVTSPLNGVPAIGYIPVTISTTNLRDNATTANYKFSNRPDFRSAPSRVAAGQLEIPPHSTLSATHWIWLGTDGDAGYNGRSGVDFALFTPEGTPSGNRLRTANISGYSTGYSNTLNLGSPTPPPPSGKRRSRTPLLDGPILFAPSSLPADWRVFSGLGTLLLAPSDWDGLSPGVRDAMRTWIGFGGNVFVVSDDRPDGNRVVQEILPPSAIGLFAHESPVKAIRASETGPYVNTEGLAGTTVLSLDVPPAEFPAARGSYSSRNFDQPRSPRSYPLRDNFGRRDIPFLLISLLLIVFAVIVGPISLQVWARPGRRHRLFFTTPILSIATSGALLLIMLFQDGFGIDGRRFTILDLAPPDSARPTALVYQEQFSRAGMIGGSGFPIEEGLVPLIPDDDRSSNTTVRDNQAVGNWLSSRRDLSLALTGAVPIRWHVTHAGRSQDSLKLRVDAPVTDFKAAWFIDGEGLMWKWDRSAPSSDGTIAFIPAGRDPAGLLEPMFERCSPGLRNTVLRHSKQENQRDRFWALTEDGAAGARPTHPEIDWLESTLVITSKVAPPR